MKVSGPGGPRGAYPVSGPGAVRGSSPASGTPPAGGGAAVSGAADATSVLGIPEAEFTPRVREAIMTLMGEVDRLRRDLEATRARIDELSALADRDPLTDVLNRRAFVRELSRLLSLAERLKVPASLVYFDLDGFKQVNDSEGHAAGDAVLVHFAEVLHRNVRESDIVGRLGGDEFALALANADEETAHTKAAALAETLKADPARHDGRTLQVGFSFGVCAMRPGEAPADAMRRADERMYALKRARA